MPDLARLCDRHAEDCARAAEKTNDPRDRAMLLKLVDGWRKAAQKLRHHKSSPLQGDNRPHKDWRRVPS